MIKTLDNGIRVSLEKVPFFHSVSVGVWVKAGSRYESQLENGISHFVEHMLFKGTTNRCAREIAAEIDNIGGVLNAFTAKECTCYYVHVMDEHVAIGIRLLADMLKNSLFDQDEIKKEQGVVCEEISMVDDTPDDLVHELASKGLYGRNPLGQTILGPKENVCSFDKCCIKNYIKKRYTADNIVLSVAGNIDQQQVLDLLTAEFSDGIFKSKGENGALDAVARGNDAVISAIKDNEQMNMCWTFEGVGNEDECFYPLTVFNGLFGGSMSSRLFQSVREERGLAYSIYSYQNSYNDCGTYNIYAAMNPEQTENVISLVKNEIMRAIEEKLSEDELNAAREQIKGSLILGTEGARPIMSRNGKMLLLKNKTEPVENIINKLNAVTAEDVSQAVIKVFGGKHCCAFVGKKDYIPKEIIL